MRMSRRRGLMIVLVVGAALAWGLWRLDRAPDRTDLSTYWAVVVGVAALAVAVIPLVKDSRTGRGHGEHLQPVALRALSDQATTFRLVVLARRDDMIAATAHAMLEGAVAIELRDVDPVTASDYLTRVQRDPPPHGWRELTDQLRHAPDSPIAQALSSPLTLTLVRDTYRTGDSVRELLDLPAGTERGEIEDLLLDRVLPTAYTPRPGQAPPRCDPRTAQRALGKIAARMNQDGTRDLLWWRVPTWTSAIPRIIATSLVTGLMVALTYRFTRTVFGVDYVVLGGVVVILSGTGIGLALSGETPRRTAPARRRPMFVFGRWSLFLLAGLGLAALIALVGYRQPSLNGTLVTIGIGWVGLIGGLGGETPQRIAPLRWRAVLSRSPLVAGLAVALTLGFWASTVSGTTGSLWGGLVGLICGLVFVLAVGLATGLVRSGGETPARLRHWPLGVVTEPPDSYSGS